MARKFIILLLGTMVLLSGLVYAQNKPSIELSLYGYLKLDGAFDQNPTSHGNFVMWVPQQATGSNDGQFSMTANETRIGVNAIGKDYEKVKVSGKIELDLFASISGVSVAENKPMLQLRHAYFSLERGHLKLTAGQTWDIVSPLNPSTLNYSVLWGSGNIGYRRPQISMWWAAKPAPTSEVTVGGGIFRTIGSDLTPTLSLAVGETADGIDDGADASIPSFQGIIDVKRTNTKGGIARFGVSGLYGKLDAETNQGQSQEYSTWVVATHLNLSPSPRFGLAAEAFSGSNLSSYLGSILQSNRISGLKTVGGWISSWLQLTAKTQFTVGYGVDDPKDEDVSSGRCKNYSLYGNIRYTVVPRATVGFEVSDWHTKYKGAEESSDLRAQTSFILSF